MALSESVLSALMKSNIQALSNFPTTGQTPTIPDDRVLTAIAKAVLDHIKAAGVISVTVTGTAAGVTSGGASAPVTGTGTGTIT